MGFITEVEEAIPALQRYARAMLRDPVRADDLVQDCLEKALRKRHLWKPSGAVRAWLDDWALQAAELKASFPAGEGLSLRRPAPRSFGWQAMAATVAVAVIGASGGWALRGAMEPAVGVSPVQMAMDAHLTFVSEVIHPVEVQAAQEDHLLKWLSNRLGGDIQAPDLASAGYTLLGGRLLPNMGANAGQFMYENDAGARVTLYVTPTPDATEAAFQFLELNGLEAFYWVDKDMSYALVGQVTKAALRGLAIEVYQQLI